MKYIQNKKSEHAMRFVLAHLSQEVDTKFKIVNAASTTVVLEDFVDSSEHVSRELGIKILTSNTTRDTKNSEKC